MRCNLLPMHLGRIAGITVFVLLGLAALTSCKPRNKGVGPNASASTQAAALPVTSAGSKTDHELADQLESAFNAAEKAHPEGFPPCGPGVTGPCSMKTASEKAGTWRATAWQHEVGALSGNATTVLIANQRMMH